MRTAPAMLVASALVALPGAAVAFDDELQLGAELFYAYQLEEEIGIHGSGAGIQVRYGLTDAIGVSGAVAWTGQFAGAPDEPELRHLVTATAGVVYALDVLRIVPFLGIRVGAAVDPVTTDAFFMLDLTGGFDFLWTRDVSTGIVAGYGLLVGDALLPARLTLGIRISWHRLV